MLVASMLVASRMNILRLVVLLNLSISKISGRSRIMAAIEVLGKYKKLITSYS